MMRIITGKARGTRLLTLPGDATRPTTEMAKEGIYSAVQFELAGAEVLDLFSGTGQLGLEALSRGAKSAVFVDSSKKAIEISRQNAERTKLLENCRFFCGDAFAFLKSAREPFDLIFADPPYAEGLSSKIAQKVLEFDLLKPRGALILESGLDCGLPKPVAEAFGSVKEYRYGKTKVLLLRKGEETK